MSQVAGTAHREVDNAPCPYLTNGRTPYVMEGPANRQTIRGTSGRWGCPRLTEVIGLQPLWMTMLPPPRVVVSVLSSLAPILLS